MNLTVRHGLPSARPVVMATQELLTAMGAFNEPLIKADLLSGKA